MRRTVFLLPGALVILLGAAVAAQEHVDQDVFWKIRQEGTKLSKKLKPPPVLTDVYGPRLTGSPNLKAAGEWAIERMHAWGLKEGRLESWEFGHPGWTNENTWHTNLDTHERILEDDVKRSAIAIAGAVYHLAMRDERLPRFAGDDMPRRPERRQPQPSATAADNP